MAQQSESQSQSSQPPPPTAPSPSKAQWQWQSVKELYYHLSHPKYDTPFISLLLTIEFFLCIIILFKIPYTEIDWKAYMQEVTMYQQGELDYVKIRGDTGPLVYPAGFIYLYSALKYITGAGAGAGGTNSVEYDDDDGDNTLVIFKAQQFFVVLYMLNIAVVLNIYNFVLKRQREKRIQYVTMIHHDCKYDTTRTGTISYNTDAALDAPAPDATTKRIQKAEKRKKKSMNITEEGRHKSDCDHQPYDSNHHHNQVNYHDLQPTSSTTATVTIKPTPLQSSPKIAHTVWSWRIAMSILCLSKRIHSIFILRLFNDAPCMLLFYISLFLFLHSKFKTGCFFFSLAVSIKMNVLLFAPGLLLILLQCNGSLLGTLECLMVCAVVQLAIGVEFLISYPFSYIRKAFEFDRVFFYQWTVNWKFLNEDAFVSKPLSILLLAFHILTLIFFAKKWIQTCRRRHQNKAFFLVSSTTQKVLQPTYIIYTLFISNFVGIVFARTLHYQFYSWYFHSMPMLLWMTDLPLLSKIAIMASIEYSFNVFPSTGMSSAILQFAHYVTLISLWKARVPMIIPKDEDGSKKFL